MNEAEFLERIYSGVKPGMVVQKPKKQSRITKVTETGSIYYLIGSSNEKAVTRADLVAVYRELASGTLTNKVIKAISGTARPCNVTTIHWLLHELHLASQSPDGEWRRAW